MGEMMCQFEEEEKTERKLETPLKNTLVKKCHPWPFPKSWTRLRHHQALSFDTNGIYKKWFDYQPKSNVDKINRIFL